MEIPVTLHIIGNYPPVSQDFWSLQPAGGNETGLSILGVFIIIFEHKLGTRKDALGHQ